MPAARPRAMAPAVITTGRRRVYPAATAAVAGSSPAASLGASQRAVVTRRATRRHEWRHSHLPRQYGRYRGREPRPADSRQRRPRQDPRQSLSHPANEQRLRSPQPVEAVKLDLDPPEARRHSIGLGRHAGAEAGQAIERRLQGCSTGRRIRVEEDGLWGQPMGRPERHPGPDAQLERTAARVQDRAVRPRPAAKNDRRDLEWIGGPAAGQAQEKVRPVKMEKSHRQEPE